MDIHPWTRYDMARARDEERLLRGRAALRARELKAAEPGQTTNETGSSKPFGWLRRRRSVADARVGAALAAMVAVLALSAAPQSADGSPQAAALPGGRDAVLAESRGIARELEPRLRSLGAGLVVAEVASTDVVETVELMPGLSRPGASLPAANGIYFAICRRSPCALQRHALSRERALRARREAVELAFRTLTETAADLVVVALPRRWSLLVLLVLTREDVQGERGAGADEVARGHLYFHGGLAPYSATRDSLLAFPLEPEAVRGSR